MMKFTSLIAAFIAVSSPALAAATTGNVSGVYSLHLTTVCQDLNGNQGTISQSVGIIEFVPSSAGALSGAVTASGTQTVGSLVIPGSTSDLRIATDPSPQSGTYSITAGSGTFSASSFTITFNNAASLTFTGYLSQLKSGVYEHADFISINGLPQQPTSCTTYGGMDYSAKSPT